MTSDHFTSISELDCRGGGTTVKLRSILRLEGDSDSLLELRTRRQRAERENWRSGVTSFFLMVYDKFDLKER